MEQAPKKIMRQEDINKLNPNVAFVVSANEQAMDVRSDGKNERLAHVEAQKAEKQKQLLEQWSNQRRDGVSLVPRRPTEAMRGVPPPAWKQKLDAAMAEVEAGKRRAQQ